MARQGASTCIYPVSLYEQTKRQSLPAAVSWFFVFQCPASNPPPQRLFWLFFLFFCIVFFNPPRICSVYLHTNVSADILSRSLFLTVSPLSLCAPFFPRRPVPLLAHLLAGSSKSPMLFSLSLSLPVIIQAAQGLCEFQCCPRLGDSKTCPFFFVSIHFFSKTCLVLPFWVCVCVCVTSLKHF